MGLNEVFKKVADIESNATELASHQVELGLVDDLNNSSKMIYNAIQNARLGLDKASKEYRLLEVKFEKEFISAMSAAKENLKQFDSASKQLGIDPNQSEEYKSLSLQVNVKGKDYGQMQQSFRNKLK